MKFIQEADKVHFAMSELSFAEVKTLRDALKGHAKGGSAPAAKLAAEIEAALEKIQV